MDPTQPSSHSRLFPAESAPPVSLDEADQEAIAGAAELLRRRIPDAAAALARTEELLERGKYDFQVVRVALHAAALAQPLTGAVDALDALGQWLSERYEVVGPGTDTRAQRKFDTTIATLIDEITSAIASPATSTPALASSRAPHGASLRTAFARLETALQARGLSAAITRLDALRGVIDTQFPREPPSVAPPAPTAGDAAPPPSMAQAVVSPAPAVNGNNEVTLPASDRFLDFRKRLEAFAELARRKDYAKASLVGSDVLKEIAAFDPTVHFPALFTDFFADLALVSAHVESVPDPDSAPWAALYRLYRVDIDRFVNAPSPRDRLRAGAVRDGHE